TNIEYLFGMLRHSYHYVPRTDKSWSGQGYGWSDDPETFTFLLDRAAMDNHPVVRATAVIYAASLMPKDAMLDSFLEARQKEEPDKSLRKYISDLAHFIKHLAAREPESMNKGTAIKREDII